jgi:hypothetical protein
MKKIKTFEQHINEMAAVMDLNGYVVGTIGDSFVFIVDEDVQDLDEDDFYDYDVVEDYVKGAVSMRMNRRHDCYEIDTIWARHGFGPVLYMLASTVSDGPIIPNQQQGYLSKEAMNVWVNFMEGVGFGKMRYWEQDDPLPKWGEDDPRRYYFEVYRPVKFQKMSSNTMFHTHLSEVADGLLREKMDEIY